MSKGNDLGNSQDFCSQGLLKPILKPIEST